MSARDRTLLIYAIHGESGGGDGNGPRNMDHLAAQLLPDETCCIKLRGKLRKWRTIPRSAGFWKGTMAVVVKLRKVGRSGRPLRKHCSNLT